VDKKPGTGGISKVQRKLTGILTIPKKGGSSVKSRPRGINKIEGGFLPKNDAAPIGVREGEESSSIQRKNIKKNQKKNSRGWIGGA